MIKNFKVGCPFCWEYLPKPKLITAVYSGEGGQGGCCSCGAFYIVDETGRSGGQALMDVQTMACAGDVDKALKLNSNVDFELKTKLLREDGRNLPGHSYLQPKIWAIKLTNN